MVYAYPKTFGRGSAAGLSTLGQFGFNLHLVYSLVVNRDLPLQDGSITTLPTLLLIIFISVSMNVVWAWVFGVECIEQFDLTANEFRHTAWYGKTEIIPYQDIVYSEETTVASMTPGLDIRSRNYAVVIRAELTNYDQFVKQIRDKLQRSNLPDGQIDDQK